MKSISQTVAAAALAALPLVNAITPEGMLAAPRRGAAVANPSGEFAVFSNSNYSFEEHESTTIWERLDLMSGEISTWSTDTNISEFVFVGPTNTSILYINATNEEGNGGVSLYTADAADLSTASLVASLPAPYSGLKAVATESGDIHFLVYALAYPNGTAYNADTAETPASTARIYTDIYVRHWDYWLSAERNAVFGGVLTSGDGGYSLSGELTNYVTGKCNATCAESPVQPFGGSGDYDISPDGSQVIFLTKNIDLPLANFTSSQVYHVPFTGTVNDSVPINPIGATPGAEGASAAPTFSKDGSKIAYFQMNGIDYESDRNIIYVANADAEDFNVTKLAGDWDRSPDVLAWSNDGSVLYVAAPDLGRERIFPIPMSATADFVPKNITDEGVPAAMQVLPNGELLVSDSKIWSSRDIYTVNSQGEMTNMYLQSNLLDEALSGLGPEDVSEFYYSTNSSEIDQQSWIIYPEGFSEDETYPLMFIVHGGPQGAHFNSWSTRWNFKVWADQGYVVIAPNPTASSGWGQNLTDAISRHWGDYPYWDLVHAWDYVNTTLPYVDTVRGVAAGASFGGYMMNWIQGHPLGRRFNALMTHDGVTNSLSDYATEELWFINHDQGGIFTSPNETSTYYRWNPILYYENWATPHFVVHNDLDFRLPVSEGLMLFNMLQVKGVPSKFLNFPDENHWVLNQENSLVWHTEIFKFHNYYSGVSNASSPY
ncbi:Dipeptidyl-peptidase 5 [Knufia obscura]|uniref:Dipeptidyl-peptidase V n=2 Tax=Knufia TaxID=430999 RepID=A0AAN8IKY3_9EURO|nr:Dipeptidyl-peptidase 5 [Knufia obscura]KAK5951682.1 Dipeptidyl-peptidase 5 [Knufia fluminis]